MRIAKIVRRSKIPTAPQMGVERGKFFVDDLYEDGTPRKLTSPAPYQNIFIGERQGRTLLREVICAKSSPNLQSSYTVATRYSTISGYNQSEYVSTKGITSGKRFFSRGGRLEDETGEVWYRPNNTLIYNAGNTYFTNARTSEAVPSESVSQIIHETPDEFVIYCAGDEALGSCALILLSKSSKGATTLLNGQFSIHKLGKTKATLDAGATSADQTLFLVMLSSRLGYGYWINTWGAEFNPKTSANGGEEGSRVLAVAFADNEYILGSALGYRTRLIHNMGLGPRSTNYNQYSISNQRFVIDADSSLVEVDAEGYVASFSFVAQDPTLIAESQLTHNSGTANEVKLNDNLCLFRTVVGENLIFTKTRVMKLTLPEDYLAAVWTMYGYQHSYGYEIISLMSGKAFSMVDDQTRYLCIFLDNVGFEHYMTAGANSSNYYTERKQPVLQPTLIKIPVDEAFLPIESETPVVHRFPARFDANIREISMLLHKQNKQLVIPSMMTNIGTYTNIVGENAIAVVDVVSGTHEVIRLDPSDNPNIYAVMAVGIIDDKIMLIDANDKPVIIDEGPSVAVELPGIVYEEDTLVTVTVDSPSKVTLHAYNGYFENGTNRVTVTVQTTLDVPVYAKKNLSVHAIKCVALEAPSEEV